MSGYAILQYRGNFLVRYAKSCSNRCLCRNMALNSKTRTCCNYYLIGGQLLGSFHHSFSLGCELADLPPSWRVSTDEHAHNAKEKKLNHQLLFENPDYAQHGGTVCAAPGLSQNSLCIWVQFESPALTPFSKSDLREIMFIWHRREWYINGKECSKKTEAL